MNKYHGEFARHMATVNFGLHIVENLIATRGWADAQHYLAETKRTLTTAALALVLELDARDATLKPLRRSSLVTRHTSPRPTKGGRP